MPMPSIPGGHQPAPICGSISITQSTIESHHLDVQHARRIVLGVAAGESGVGQHRGAQFVVGVQIRQPHAFIDDLLQRSAGVVKPAIHTPFDEDVDDAGILADRAVPLGAHPAVGQDLRDRILGGGALLGLIRFAERTDIIHRVIERDELQRVGHALDQIGFADDGGHDELLSCAAP
jgi:hypothetical protein